MLRFVATDFDLVSTTSRRIHWLLEQDGWMVSLKRVKRIWRREGLKVPQKQPKRGQALAQ